MNNAKQPMPIRMHKKVIKTIKKDLQSGQDTIAEPEKKEYPTEIEMVKKTPSRKAKVQMQHKLSMEKSIQRKKAKLHSKHSKRTSPDSHIENSPPAHTHVESKRWINALASQAKIKIKRFIKKMLKRK
jgi:hypothetical protein